MTARRYVATIGICAALGLLTGAAGEAEQASWHENFDAAATAAEQTGRPILAVFHSVGCGPCERMQHETLGDPKVAAVIAESFESVRVNAIEQPDLATKYTVSFYPTVKFIDADGTSVYDSQGFVESEDFIGVMANALAAHQALERARKAAADQPEPPEEALAVAEDFLAARQHQQAASWARSALEAGTENDATTGHAKYVLGAALMEAGEPGEAAQILESALNVAGDAKWRWDARVKLGFAWLQRGNEQEGIELLRSVHGAEQADAQVKSEAARLLRWWGVEID